MITTQGRLSSKERKYRSENDDLWLVNKPYKYGDKWSVWPKTILNDMEISDCNDTIEGVCLENQTLDECINRCTGDCGAGVYFKFHNGKSICVPIRTAVHPSFNPIYRLRKQSYYDIKDVDVSVFVNTELFPNPPDLGNAIFYFDIISIKSSGKTIGVNYRQGEENIVKTVHNLASNVQIIPQIHTVGTVEDDIPLKYGDRINIIVPGTNQTASNKANKVVWSVVPLDTAKIKDMYYIFLPPTDSDAKIGDFIRNDTPVVISYNGLNGYSGYINLNSQDELVIENDIKSTFSIISKMMGNYCDGGICQQIPVKDITPAQGVGGKYMDSNGNWTPTYRHKGCWNRCREGNDLLSSKQSPSRIRYLWLILLCLGIIILILIAFIWIRGDTVRAFIGTLLNIS